MSHSQIKQDQLLIPFLPIPPNAHFVTQSSFPRMPSHQGFFDDSGSDSEQFPTTTAKNSAMNRRQLKPIPSSQTSPGRDPNDSSNGQTPEQTKKLVSKINPKNDQTPSHSVTNGSKPPPTSPSLSTNTPISNKQLIYLSIAAICAALNHHSYLFITVIALALCSSSISPLLTLGSIFHVLLAGSISTIVLAMLENPHLSRPERLRRQLGHTLMLSHFGGIGSIGEVVRLYYGVEGCGIDNVKKSLMYQFCLISPIKLVTLTGIYTGLATKLAQPSSIGNALDIGNLSTVIGNTSGGSIIGVNAEHLKLIYHIGLVVFGVICSTFILPVIAYIFVVAIDDVSDDEPFGNY